MGIERSPGGAGRPLTGIASDAVGERRFVEVNGAGD
jgi:hypothetical protein